MLEDVDGEDMQTILEKAGMDYQMLRQLIMTYDFEEVMNIVEEIKEMEEYEEERSDDEPDFTKLKYK